MELLKNFKSRLKWNLQTLAVSASILAIFIPVRKFFVDYVSDSWLGSFGTLTVIFGVILYLSRKGKLGWYGRVFEERLTKVVRGKRRILVWFVSGFTIYFLAASIYGIESSDNQYKELKDSLKSSIPKEQQNMENMVKQTEGVPLAYYPLALLLVLWTLIFRFDLYAAMMGYINDVTDGYFLHLITIMFVQEVELIGFLVFYRYFLSKPKIH
jgi:hypothetical protein